MNRPLWLRSRILNTVNNISKVMENDDYWRWEIIKALVRHRDGDLSTDKAQKTIIDLARFMPDLFLVQAYIDEFQSNYEKEKDNE